MLSPHPVGLEGRGFGRGDRLPDFVLPELGGGLSRFYGVAGGKPAALLFTDQAELACAWERALPEEVMFFWVSRVPQPVGLVRGRGWVDAEGQLGGLKPGEGAWVWALDPNLRVIDGFSAQDPEALIAALGGPPAAPRAIGRQAPVLLIPEAIDRTTCAELIAHFERSGHEETGVEQSAAGRRHLALAPDRKKRRDHVVTDPALLAELTHLVGRRVVPEVQLAFSFRATRFEGFKLVAYGPGGLFVAHRDNLSPSTAHRRFALTLNLNDGYQGGELRFPEYSADLYQPGLGGAVVFSCSLLHEVLPVREGQRHALLSFLFSGEDRRQPRPDQAGKV